MLISSRINPVENTWYDILSLGEGSHNYHHVFPWDYRSYEFDQKVISWSTGFIHFFARFGWAYDLKSVTPDNISKRVGRTGDGSHPLYETSKIE